MTEARERRKFVSEDTCTIRGQKINYVATSEEFYLLDTEGQAEASIFTFAYEKKNKAADEQRPLLFAYNGGPGSCSLLVHLGVLAPWRVKMGKAVDMSFTGPFKMVENEGSVLDICDIIVIDAIGTGYSRVLKDSAKNKYFNSEGDAISMVKVIRMWMTAHKRWNSNIYLMGESYGTIRNALIADAMNYNESKDFCGSTGIHVSGIIMLGTALDHGQTPFPVDTAVLNFPAVAATYWYHHREGKPELKKFVDEAYDFSIDEYQPALTLGRRLTGDRRESVLSKLEYFTGMSKSQLIDSRLRVETSTYPIKGMENEGKVLSRYDGRFAADRRMDMDDYQVFLEDVGNQHLMPAFIHCYNGIWKEKLSICIEEEYESLSNMVGEQWSFKTACPPVKLLERAMYRNPNMKLMFGTGYYDMLTTTGYTRYLAYQFDLPQDRVWLKEYESGHMPYLGDDNAVRLGDDLRNFILWEV